VLAALGVVLLVVYSIRGGCWVAAACACCGLLRVVRFSDHLCDAAAAFWLCGVLRTNICVTIQLATDRERAHGREFGDDPASERSDGQMVAIAVYDDSTSIKPIQNQY